MNMLEDLSHMIERLQDKNHKIIMLIDANENRNPNKTKSFGAISENLEMTPLLNDTYKFLPSTRSGRDLIDHV